MTLAQKCGIWVLGMAAALALTACGPIKPEPEQWSLPKKADPDSGMIVGRIDFPDDKKENPENLALNLIIVEFRDTASVVHFGDKGEEHYIMNNNYFVVPNLKPGKYRLASFKAGKVYHGLPYDSDDYRFEVKPGQIKFVGSLDYLQEEPGALKKIAMVFNARPRLHYALRPASHPSELEMFQWLNRIGAGSGWESTIRKRIKELGEQVK